MEIYLPIAEMSVNMFGILLLGMATGVLSGMFGVGGGFLMTPFLIMIGIPPTVAVASSANQIVASSVSGFLGHWRRGNVDFQIGNLLMLGGLVGSTLGIALFRWLQHKGQIDWVISLLYVCLLGGIGAVMARETVHSILKRQLPDPVALDARFPRLKRLPWQRDFPHSRIRVSGWLPVALGFAIGILVSMMGVGGGFFLIPAMIYLLGMPTSVVIGTSLFQIIFITTNVTILQAVTTQTVDIVLALLLLAGSVFGAQFGTRLGAKLPPEQLRGLLASVVLIVAICLGFSLFNTPESMYAILPH